MCCITPESQEHFPSRFLNTATSDLTTIHEHMNMFLVINHK